MRLSSGWFLVDLTWGWLQSRRSARAPPPWPRQWRLWRRMICRPGVRQGSARSWIGTGTLFGAALVVTRLLTMTFEPDAKVVKA